jgi:hypothetical protein
MPLLLPPSWAQAAGFVAIGYGVRNAGMCKDKEIQVGAVLASFCAMQAIPGCTAGLYAGCFSVRVYCLSSSNDTSVPFAVRSRQAYSLSLSSKPAPLPSQRCLQATKPALCLGLSRGGNCHCISAFIGCYVVSLSASQQRFIVSDNLSDCTLCEV